ncbi:hypothetical protein V6N13_044252 [Hibiscus sabdariffa]|uniref:Uncharacterized protein n=1 Tax=Hibiscus sabdariffa TaxID=183260 RepID=A0ABR2RHL8_9ROSI
MKMKMKITGTCQMETFYFLIFIFDSFEGTLSPNGDTEVMLLGAFLRNLFGATVYQRDGAEWEGLSPPPLLFSAYMSIGAKFDTAPRQPLQVFYCCN